MRGPLCRGIESAENSWVPSGSWKVDYRPYILSASKHCSNLAALDQKRRLSSTARIFGISISLPGRFDMNYPYEAWSFSPALALCARRDLLRLRWAIAG